MVTRHLLPHEVTFLTVNSHVKYKKNFEEICTLVFSVVLHINISPPITKFSIYNQMQNIVKMRPFAFVTNNVIVYMHIFLHMDIYKVSFYC